MYQNEASKKSKVKQSSRKVEHNTFRAEEN